MRFLFESDNGLLFVKKKTSDQADKFFGCHYGRRHRFLVTCRKNQLSGWGAPRTSSRLRAAPRPLPSRQRGPVDGGISVAGRAPCLGGGKGLLECSITVERGQFYSCLLCGSKKNTGAWGRIFFSPLSRLRCLRASSVCPSYAQLLTNEGLAFVHFPPLGGYPAIQ